MRKTVPVALCMFGLAAPADGADYSVCTLPDGSVELSNRGPSSSCRETRKASVSNQPTLKTHGGISAARRKVLDALAAQAQRKRQEEAARREADVEVLRTHSLALVQTRSRIAQVRSRLKSERFRWAVFLPGSTLWWPFFADPEEMAALELELAVLEEEEKQLRAAIRAIERRS